MTVEELIKRLQELPKDAVVVTYDPHFEVWNEQEVENINEYHMFEYDSGMYRTSENHSGFDVKVVTV